jgi:hypothetical protein
MNKRYHVQLWTKGDIPEVVSFLYIPFDEAEKAMYDFIRKNPVAYSNVETMTGEYSYAILNSTNYEIAFEVCHQELVALVRKIKIETLLNNV